ncbi:hypothetical protein FRC03_007519 [Tulasnella sp. 419]|nr:hypothetical protein FRC03_007519 [Tulasnella sp. 419]
MTLGSSWQMEIASCLLSKLSREQEQFHPSSIGKMACLKLTNRGKPDFNLLSLHYLAAAELVVSVESWKAQGVKGHHQPSDSYVSNVADHRHCKGFSAQGVPRSMMEVK